MPNQHWPGSWVRWGAKRGALVGVALATLIGVGHAAGLAWGRTTDAGVGLGTGVVAWLVSWPAGLLIFRRLGGPLAAALGIPQTPALNLVTILLFGVIGNWVVLGTGFGVVRGWLAQEITPPAT